MKKHLTGLFIVSLLVLMPLAALAAGHGGSMGGNDGMQGQDMKGMQGQDMKGMQGQDMKGMQGQDMKGMQDGEMKGEGMKGMSGMNDMIMLGSKTTDGVVAVGHLMPVAGDEKDGMGMKMTHRFMIMCNNEETGAYIEEGLAALKVTDPSGHTSEPLKLMAMPMGMVKGFGTGVNLNEKGTYKFEVGSKLADGQKRSFEFSYTLE